MMTDSAVHVVFGADQVGDALIRRLASAGHPVIAVSRRRPQTVAPGVEWRVADAADPAATVAAAAGASVVYQCLGAPYTKWPEQFPPMQRNVIAAAEAAGALLVTLENVYCYGPTGGRPMTEDHPLAATTVKGRTRAAMTRGLAALLQNELDELTAACGPPNRSWPNRDGRRDVVQGVVGRAIGGH
jgi:uncharacterized protein YbjT (DUF2867 family)